MKATTLHYSSREINREFLIKVAGRLVSGEYINKLVGVKGLLEYVGIDRADKMLKRAFASKTDCLTCKVYGGIRVSFYIH